MINKEYTTSIPIKGEEIKYVGSFTQNDINGVNRINAMLMDGMNAFDITGYTTITFSVLKPDGTICIDGQGERINVRDAENGVITIDLHNNVMDRQGTCLATLEVYEGERKLSTSRLRFVIVGDLADGADPTGESTFPALTEILTTWSTDEAARKANELIRIANEDTRIANELRRIANEGVNAQNIQIINQILTTKADKSTTLSGYSIGDAYTKNQVDSLLKFYENELNYIESILGILSPGEDPGGVNQGAMNGMAVRVNTVAVGTTWIGTPTPGANAIQYVTLPSITPFSNVLVSPTAGAFAYPGTDYEVSLEGNIKEYIDCGVHCAWAGLDEQGVGQLMFACSKLTTKTVYVDIMELVNVGSTTSEEPSKPSSNNHYHNVSDIQGMPEYKETLDQKVTAVDTKIAAFDTNVSAQILAINQLSTNAMTDLAAEKVQSLSDISAAEAAAVARMATFDPDGVINSIGDLTALPTIEKTNLVGAVAEVFTYGSSFKTDVAAAITAKGVETLATDTKEAFVANIAAIQSGGGSESRPLIFEIETTAANTAFEFPAYAPYDLQIDWGDGSDNDSAAEKGDSRISMSHVYVAAGRYVVTVSGFCAGFRFGDIAASRILVKKVTQIGDVPRSLFESFRGCINLTDISALTIDSKFILDSSFMFYECTGITSIPYTLMQNANIINIERMFYGCTGLTSLPGFLFSGMSILNSKSVFRSCSNITTVPDDFFNGCLNFSGGATRFDAMFNGCTKLTSISEFAYRGYLGTTITYHFAEVKNITSIPEGLFANLPQVKEISRVFYTCTGITSIPVGLFAGCPNLEDITSLFYECSNITSIPVGLFAGCPNLKITTYAFYTCSKISSLPAGLFSGLKITNADYMMQYCTGLTSLPADLLSGCLGLDVSDSGRAWLRYSNVATLDENVLRGYLGTSITRMFAYSKIKAIPDNILAVVPQVVNVYYAFSECTSITSAVPELWNYTDRTWSDTQKCFGNCTKATNYAAIPAAWK